MDCVPCYELWPCPDVPRRIALNILDTWEEVSGGREGFATRGGSGGVTWGGYCCRGTWKGVWWKWRVASVDGETGGRAVPRGRDGRMDSAMADEPGLTRIPVQSMLKFPSDLF